MMSMLYQSCGSSQLETPTASGALAPWAACKYSRPDATHASTKSSVNFVSLSRGLICE
jgi:hypothetical protein